MYAPLTSEQLRSFIVCHFDDPGNYAGAHCHRCPAIECSISDEIEIAEYNNYNYDVYLMVYGAHLIHWPSITSEYLVDDTLPF